MTDPGTGSAPAAEGAAVEGAAVEGAVVGLGVHDLARVLELCALALPDEALTLDDLEAVTVPTVDPHAGAPQDDDVADAADEALVRCIDVAAWGVDLGGALAGVAVASLTDVVGVRTAHLQLLAVHPARRRRHTGGRLVAEFERWARDRGAGELVIGAGAPFYLFTGVDSRWTDALCCFEALGYRRAETELDLVCATTPPAGPAAGRPTQPTGRHPVQLCHVGDDEAAATLRAWVRRHYPHWQAEFERAAQQGTVVLAVDGEGSLVGAAAHSVTRTGVIGPVAVEPGVQRSGVGVQLMRAVLAELSAAGLRQAEIAWTSTVRFYARACGARVGRASVVLRKAAGPER